MSANLFVHTWKTRMSLSLKKNKSNKNSWLFKIPKTNNSDFFISFMFRSIQHSKSHQFDVCGYE